MTEVFAKSLEEIDPYWRLYAYIEGRVLSAEDVKDIQQVLQDYNDEIGENAERFQAAREQILREIGGEELVELAAKADSAQSAVAVEKAMAHFRAKCLEYEGKKPALPDEASKLREALEQIRDLEPEAEPIGDRNTDDTMIAFADGAHFGRWQASTIARAALTTDGGDRG